MQTDIKKEPCNCDAYKFPHRKGSGLCGEQVTYEENTDKRAWWQVAADDAGVTDKDFI